MDKVVIKDKFEDIKEYWNPKIAGELNGQYVKLVKVKGAFVWHKHDEEDELFLVVKGELKMNFRDKVVLVNEGEFIVVPRGIEHKPEADTEAWILLFEPATTLNTGNVENEFTRRTLNKI